EMGDSPQASASRAEALIVRRDAIETLESLDGDEARLWLDAFRLATNDVELVYDLRSIALLYEEHAELLGAGFDAHGSALAARRCADALERCLMAAEPAGEWSAWLAPAFSLTLSLYTEVSRIARSVGGVGGAVLACPSAAGIARSARRNRDSTSSVHNVRNARPNPPESGVAPAHPVALPPVPPPAPVRAAAPAPPTALAYVPGPAPAHPVALPSVPPPAPVRAAAPAPPPPLASGPARAGAPSPEPELERPPAPEPESGPMSEPATDSSRARRRSERLSAELEVSLFSDSNFYVGFTENVSEGGLFVATYLTRPLGSAVEICARIPGRTEPLIVRGTVRWLREYSPTSDGYPGMGIQFDTISERDQSDIAAFLVTRDPLFFVE
ncbi:MAG TPA: PilZ domain-containing protein, partial [Gemmatimonadales bacterium]|nr:PilZ domain-containing protein [Gemmatimonadales bacterium]